ncbi:MAG: ATP-binding protein [Myxococcota bacterium]
MTRSNHLRARLLVSDLRDFAAPQKDNHIEVDLAEGIRTTAALFRPSIRTGNTSLEVAITGRLNGIIGNANSINQILLNLLKNAGDAASNIRIETKSYPGRIDVRITDDGLGIPQHLLETIFDPFYTTKKAGEGNGLGLSISRRMAKSHGGDLTIESELGVGTTFTLSLPRHDR